MVTRKKKILSDIQSISQEKKTLSYNIYVCSL